MLSPSEVVVLHATDFVPASRFGAHPLGSPLKVNERNWMRLTYRAATVAVVVVGDARLTARPPAEASTPIRGSTSTAP